MSRFAAFLCALLPVWGAATANLVAQDGPPAPPTAPTPAPDPAPAPVPNPTPPPPVVTTPPLPPTPTPTPAPTPAPTDVPPTHGGKFGREIFDITMVDLPARGALTKVKQFGLAGWQLCQVEQFSEMVQDNEGVWHQEDKVRFWLQRKKTPTDQAQ